MKKFSRLVIFCSALFSFSAYSMDCLRLTEAYLNLSVITLEGSQSSVEISNTTEFKAVKDDAINFLATGEETEVLSSFLNQLKNTFHSLNALTDQELALKVVSEL